MGKDRARMKFLRRLAVRALINRECGRKFCLKHSPASGEATGFWDHSLCKFKLERCACDCRPKKSIREHIVPNQNWAINLILHALGCLDRVDFVVVNALSLRDEVIFHSVANTNFSLRAVSWSRYIFPALYRQHLGLDCDRVLCVILHTRQMLQNRTIISM
eukprot:2526823-Pleurochrysis_carterae.AAC.1